MSMPWSRWKPRLLETIPHYTISDLFPDLVAGVTVGLVALPLAMAFGIASGTTPQAGICRTIVGGPTGAFVAAIIAEHGIAGPT